MHIENLNELMLIEKKDRIKKLWEIKRNMLKNDIN